MVDISNINLRKDALRLKEVQNELPFSESTTYRMRKAGDFPPSFKIRGVEFWLRSDIQEWKAKLLEGRGKDAA
ncbi:MAG: AlpA family phage regulatory protein [Pseudomonadota bacterium]